MVALSKGEYCFLYQTTDKWKSIVLQALPFSVHAKVVFWVRRRRFSREICYQDFTFERNFPEQQNLV